MQQDTSLTNFAYEDIKRRILTGMYNHDYVFTVNSFVDELGISPTPIKEALNRLVEDGFLMSIPRRGYKLKHLFLKDVRDLLNLRMMLESSAAPFVVQNAPNHPEILKRMFALIERNNRLADTEFSPEKIEQLRLLDEEFHVLYIDITENQLLKKIYLPLWENSTLHYLYSLTQYPLSIYDGFKSHILLYNAIMEGDAENLRRAAKEHVVGPMETVEKIDAMKDSFGILF